MYENSTSVKTRKITAAERWQDSGVGVSAEMYIILTLSRQQVNMEGVLSLYQLQIKTVADRKERGL